MVEQNPILEVNVQFGGVSFGDQTARLGISFDEDLFSSKSAEEFLVGSRLKIVAVPGSQDSTSFRQKELVESGKRLESEVDCKGYSRGMHGFKAGLTFNVSSVDESILVHLRKKAGRLSMERIGSCGHDDDEDSIDPDDREFEDRSQRPLGFPALNATAKALRETKGMGTEADPAAGAKIEDLSRDHLRKLADKVGKHYGGQGLTESKVGAIKEGLDITKITELEKVMDSNPFWFNKVSRLGQGGIDMVTDARMFYRQCVGFPSDEEVKSDATEEGIDVAASISPDVPDSEAYAVGANAAASAEDSEEAPVCPYPRGSNAATMWKRGFDETNSAETDDETGTMFAKDKTEDVEIEVDGVPLEEGADQE